MTKRQSKYEYGLLNRFLNLEDVRVNDEKVKINNRLNNKQSNTNYIVLNRFLNTQEALCEKQNEITNNKLLKTNLKVNQ